MAGSGPLSSSPGPNTFGSRGYGTSPGTAGVFGALSRRSGEDGNTSGRGDRPPAVRHSEDELLTALRKGTELSKHGRHGRPKMHFFYICEGDTRLSWRSAKGNIRHVQLASVKQVVPGQTTDTFRRQPLPQWEQLSFSLLYRSLEDGQPRTLDLICKSQPEHDLWFNGLQIVVERAWQAKSRPRVPLPVVTARVGDWPHVTTGSPAPQGPGPPPPRLPPATRPSPGPVTGGGTAQGRITGALGLPVLEHRPGDCYVWGASRASAASGRSWTASQDSWWQHGLAPSLVANTTHLDVAEVAVGGRHAGLLTHSAELHTWGEGNGGKLGLGHYENAASPVRVTALWGQPLKHIACGDGMMAAITVDGKLLTWGDGAVGSLGYPGALRQAIPRKVDALGDLVIVQVACGPYHCAAISAGGDVYTWGNGLCGKLGHGDDESCVLPRQVEGLKGHRVLHVACGVWHSAAIASDRSDSGGPLQDLPYLESQAIQSKLASMYDQLDGEGGHLYTWGGSFTWVERRHTKAGAVVEKRDNHRGCLGTGNLDGQLVPTRVRGALEHAALRQVECGYNLTVALGLDGRVWQCGETGASGRAKWEGSDSPEQVTGALAGHRIERIAVGLQHVVALSSPANQRTGRAEPGQECSVIFTWGRGREGQLGTASTSDSVSPRLVETLRGRRVLQVSAGGHHSAAVCVHDREIEDGEERRRGGVKNRMWDWFAGSKLMIELPDRSEGSGGAQQLTPGTRGSRGGGLPLPHAVSDQDLLVTGRQFATADAPNVAGLRRAAPGGPAAMQVALSGKGAGFLELARTANNMRPHVRVRHRHSGAGTYAALHRSNTGTSTRGRRLTSPERFTGSAPLLAEDLAGGMELVRASGASFPGSSLSRPSRARTEFSADSETSGAYGPSSSSTPRASRESLAELAGLHTPASAPPRDQFPAAQAFGSPEVPDLESVETELAEIESLQAELEQRRAVLLQQQAAALRASSAAGTAAVWQDNCTATSPFSAEGGQARARAAATPAPGKARERSVSLATEYATPLNVGTPGPLGRRRAASEISPRSAAAGGAGGPELQEQVAEGVFLTFREGPDGHRRMTRIRFSRQHFSRETAEAWWIANQRELSRLYNLTGAAGVPGGTTPASAPPAMRPPALTPLHIPSPAGRATGVSPDTRPRDDSPAPESTGPSHGLASGSPLGTAASWVFSVSGTAQTPAPAPGPSRFARSPSPLTDAEPFETPAAQTRSSSRLPATPASVLLPLAETAAGANRTADAPEALETFRTADSVDDAPEALETFRTADSREPWSFDGGPAPSSRPASTPSSSGTASTRGGLRRASTPGSVSTSKGDASARPRVRIVVPDPTDEFLMQAAATAMQQSRPKTEGSTEAQGSGT